RHDRRSVVLAAGPASAAYKAACDLLIDQDTFLEEAIGIGEGSPVRPGADSELLQRIAAKVHERAGANGELVATDLPGIFREFAEFTPDSNWLGFYSLRGMTSAVVNARRDLEMVEGDPWRVRACAPRPELEGAEGAGAADDAPATDAQESLAFGAGAGAGAGGGPVEGAASGGGSGNGSTAMFAGASGSAGGVGSGATAAASPQLLRAIADKVHARAGAAGELLATDLPGIYREFPQFTPNSNWLGFYSLRGLSDAVIRSRGDLEMVDGDPWRVRLRPLLPSSSEPGPGPAGEGEPGQRHGAGGRGRGNGRGAAMTGPGTAGAAGSAGATGATGTQTADPAAADGGAEGGGAAADVAPAPTSPADLERQRQVDAIVEFVHGLVASSDSPVPMTRAAHAVLDRFGEDLADSRWHGAGTFRDLLAGYGDLGFAVSATRPGYLYDPDLHQTPLEPHEDLEIGDPEMTSLAHRIHRITDTPYLAPGDYALVFREIAEEVNEEGYFLTRTSKAVRDRCIEEGAPVARTSVNFILRGIASAGYRFGATAGTDPLELASAFVKNVLGLCESAGMPLSDEERQQLTAWIAGGLEPEPT
ncbi:MAG TPA: hypothetical protein VHB47_08910, partial [Thermoanaerobaculia bacterium]|nr:hypothetical protein [Thermoanaerobaculia bacterium]